MSMLHGLLVSVYFMDTTEHNSPHRHLRYQGQHEVFGIVVGDLLPGKLTPKQGKLNQAWIAIHADELMADWTLAIEGKQLFRINPLR